MNVYEATLLIVLVVLIVVVSLWAYYSKSQRSRRWSRIAEYWSAFKRTEGYGDVLVAFEFSLNVYKDYGIEPFHEVGCQHIEHFYNAAYLSLVNRIDCVQKQFKENPKIISEDMLAKLKQEHDDYLLFLEAQQLNLHRCWSEYKEQHML